MFITPPLKWPISPACAVSAAANAATATTMTWMRRGIGCVLLIVGLLLDVELEFLAGKRRRQLGTLQHGFELCLQIQRLGGGGGQFVRALLQRRHHVGMLIGDIVLLGWVLRDVVKLH